MIQLETLIEFKFLNSSFSSLSSVKRFEETSISVNSTPPLRRAPRIPFEEQQHAARIVGAWQRGGFHASKGRMIQLEFLFELEFLNTIVRAYPAYALIETRQTAPCRAIRGNCISVSSTLPPLLQAVHVSGGRDDPPEWILSCMQASQMAGI